MTSRSTRPPSTQVQPAVLLKALEGEAWGLKGARSTPVPSSPPRREKGCRRTPDWHDRLQCHPTPHAMRTVPSKPHTRPNAGERVEFLAMAEHEYVDPNMVAGLLKLWFRELPPLIGRAEMDALMGAMGASPATLLLRDVVGFIGCLRFDTGCCASSSPCCSRCLKAMVVGCCGPLVLLTTFVPPPACVTFPAAVHFAHRHAQGNPTLTA